MQRTLIAIALCSGFAVLLPQSSIAAPPHGGPRFGGGPHFERLYEEHAEELGLDPETIAAIRAIVDSSEERAKELEAQSVRAHDALRALLSEDLPDESTVMKATDEVGRIETQLRKHRLATMLRIRALLTPEQRERLVEFRRSRDSEEGRGELREACQPDVERLCADAESGWARMRCLRENQAEVSEECQSAIESMRGRGPRGGGRTGRRGF